MVNEVDALAIESWTLYPFGLLLIAARIASRIILLGSWKKLQIDDWIMLFVAVTFTGVIVSVNQVSHNLSNYLPPGVAETFTDEERENAIYGSKFVMILEEFMLANTWLCKACLLILYHHMTLGLKQNKLVKIVAGYCVFGYILTQILYLGVWCRPIQQYWQVPVEDSQCASYYPHLITSSVFNISSDLAMLYIPLPILVKARLPFLRKTLLVVIFSLGVLVILSAILNRYYNFTEGFGSLIYLNWYTGEAATSVFVANVPCLWPLLSKMFRLGSFGAKTTGAGSGQRRPPDGVATYYKSFGGTIRGEGRSQKNNRAHLDEMSYMRTQSEERLAGNGAGQGVSAASGGGGGIGTWPLGGRERDADVESGGTMEMGFLDDDKSAGGGVGMGGGGGMAGGLMGMGGAGGPMGHHESMAGTGMGYTASAAAAGGGGGAGSRHGGGGGGVDAEGGGAGGGGGGGRGGIIRTIQIRQYSSDV